MKTTDNTEAQILLMNFDDLRRVATKAGVYKTGMKKDEMLKETLDELYPKKDAKPRDTSENSDGGNETGQDDENSASTQPNISEKIRKLHDDGKTNAEIAEELGCRRKYVCDVTWRHHNK